MGEETKKHNDSKLMRRLLIGIAIVFAILIFAGVAGNKSLNDKLADAKLKCQAIELMDGSEGDDEAWLNYSIAKTNCDAIYTNVYELDQKKFVEEVNSTFDTYTSNGREVAGHKIDWYLEQVKANQ